MYRDARTGTADASVLPRWRVPRHEFGRGVAAHAFLNQPLRSGRARRSSSPHRRAETDLARVRPATRARVGPDGYQAAIPPRWARRDTIENRAGARDERPRRLARLGQGRKWSGRRLGGIPAHAPFDAIPRERGRAPCAAALVRQLAGREHGVRSATREPRSSPVREKRTDGTVATTRVLPVRFVPSPAEDDCFIAASPRRFISALEILIVVAMCQTCRTIFDGAGRSHRTRPDGPRIRAPAATAAARRRRVSSREVEVTTSAARFGERKSIRGYSSAR